MHTTTCRWEIVQVYPENFRDAKKCPVTNCILRGRWKRHCDDSPHDLNSPIVCCQRLRARPGETTEELPEHPGYGSATTYLY